jgi:hypothetical protein
MYGDAVTEAWQMLKRIKVCSRSLIEPRLPGQQGRAAALIIVSLSLTLQGSRSAVTRGGLLIPASVGWSAKRQHIMVGQRNDCTRGYENGQCHTFLVRLSSLDSRLGDDVENSGCHRYGPRGREYRARTSEHLIKVILIFACVEQPSKETLASGYMADHAVLGLLP